MSSRHHPIPHVLATMIFGASLLLGGCDNTPTEISDYEPQPILTAYLANGEPLDEVFLERVGALDEAYDPKANGIVGAMVTIFSTDGGDTLFLVDDPEYPGRYVPPQGEDWIPEGKTRYRVEADLGGHELIWAETTVPDTFSIQTFPVMLDGSTFTREDPNIMFDWTGADSSGGYVMNVLALCPRDSLQPLDPDFDPEKDELDPQDLRRTFYTIMRHDQRSLIVPWIMFQWQGWHRVDVFATSAEYYDYLFAMFRIESGILVDLPSNVHGGLGMVAGLSRHSYRLCMEKVG